MCLCCAVEPPSDLRFKILKENSVQMSWNRPRSRIQGYRIQVSGGPGECVITPEGCAREASLDTGLLYACLDAPTLISKSEKRANSECCQNQLESDVKTCQTQLTMEMVC